MRVRDRLGLSVPTQRRVTRAMELCLVGIVLLGLYERNLGIVVNSVIALGVTFLPALLERDYNIPMDAGLTLWITAAVFFHAVGTIGIPGSGTSFYQSVWWWDHLTHALSSSLVAAVGYAAARSVDEHTSEVYLPPKFMVVFILLFVLAFGVFWEVIEFAIGEVAALFGSEDAILTQYGLEDTMKDLLFNTIGGLVTAVWGAAYLTDVVGALTRKLDARDPS